MPVVDPRFAFDLALYKSTGALFWPDVCSCYSNRLEMWDVFELPRPEAWPHIPDNETKIWTTECDPREPTEIQGGEVLVNKRRAWKGLVMTVFINYHHTFFNKRLSFTDKPTFHFGFASTKTPYSLSPFGHFGVGKAVTLPNGRVLFCSTTYAQRHPETGSLIWIHRGGVKFSWFVSLWSS